MPYNVLDIARFVINYCNENNIIISNLKLQKLLYFIQAAYLAYSDTGNPCFDEDFEAWTFGPVIPCVYHEFKRYGGNNIPQITNYHIYNEDTGELINAEYDINTINNVDQIQIAQIIYTFSQYTASQLVEITHAQAPWINAYKNKQIDNIISKESIRMYFSSLEEV